MSPLLFESIPDDPLRLLADWLEEAETRSGQENWNTMMLATADGEGRPAVRAVLLKGFDPATGAVTFYTNYHSRKAREMEVNPRVAAVCHWDRLHRQVRVEGSVERAPDHVSDAYFASRPRMSQVGAWASDQSQPLDRWSTLVGRVLRTSLRFTGRAVPRPPHWGGYVIHPDRLEFWVGGESRIHQRVEFRRGEEGSWTPRRLYP